MEELHIIGVDLAKRVFQVHGSDGAGQVVRLIPPNYVKPFVKRHKNDAVEAEVIVEAAMRPPMRFVAVKTKDQQAQAVMFRTSLAKWITPAGYLGAGMLKYVGYCLRLQLV